MPRAAWIIIVVFAFGLALLIAANGLTAFTAIALVGFPLVGMARFYGQRRLIEAELAVYEKKRDENRIGDGYHRPADEARLHELIQARTDEYYEKKIAIAKSRLAQYRRSDEQQADHTPGST